MEILRPPTKPRFRIGLLIDSFIQPRWIHRIIEELKLSSIAEVSVIVKNISAGDVDSFNRMWQERSYLLYHIYTKLDELLFKVEPDAFEAVSIEDLISEVPIINIEPIKGKYIDTLKDEDTRAILHYELDVALRFGFRILRGDFLRIAKFGVWSYHHGDSLVNRGLPPAFWEVMRNEPVIGSMLQILTEELDNGRVIYRSWAPTINKFSVKKTRNNYYWKSAAFIMRKLKELHELGPSSLDSDICNSTYRPYFKRLFKKPGNLEMLVLFTGLVGRSLSRLLEKTLFINQWSLAYRIGRNEEDPNNAMYKFRYLIPPKDRFWADPFPIRESGKYFVFFEEFIYQKDRGHISVVEVNEQGAASKPLVALERGARRPPHGCVRQPPGLLERAHELPEEPRLAHARFPYHAHDLGTPGTHPVKGGQELPELALAADQRGLKAESLEPAGGPGRLKGAPTAFL